MKERILLVEDDAALADAVSSALRKSGYDVVTVNEDVLGAARTPVYDLIILDGGIDVCKSIRSESDLPIVMLSGRDGELDKVVAFELGADDYITKPFSVAELISRVRALLRRRELDRDRQSVIQRVGALQLDITRHSASIDGKPLQLTRSEFRLVTLLASEPGRVFTREELVRHLWQSDFVGDRRAIDVHISNLRRKVEVEPRNPRRLVTVRGVGYKLLAA